MGRHTSFRREYRQNGFSDRNGGVSTGGHGGGGSSDSSARGLPVEHTEDSNGDFAGMLGGIEKKLSGVQQDFTSAIHKINEKENEKFDLIFAILSELQQRQANLEDSVRFLKAQFPNGNNTPQPQQQAQGPTQSYGQMNGQMGVQLNGNMGNQQPMQQQFTTMQQPMQQGVMQPDGTVFMQQPQQMIIMQQPNNGGMQYAAMPQMMTSGGAIVQQMPAQMAMQFMAQNCSEMGQNFANGQDGCQATGSSIQAQMDMIKPDNNAFQSEGCSTMDTQLDQRPVEAQGQNSSMSGVGSSETSSQEGKVVDDGSPCQMQPCADGSMP